MLTASVCSFGCILPTRAVSFINLFLLLRCYLLNQLRAVDSAMCGMCVSECLSHKKSIIYLQIRATSNMPKKSTYKKLSKQVG